MKMRIDKRRCTTPRNNGFAAEPIRTFLADDDPSMIALLGRILSTNERITIVGSGMDGRNALDSASKSQPDLVLMDRHMPGLDGAEATRRLKQLPNPPIIFLVTSDDSPESRARSLNAGADAFLVKAADLAVQLNTAIQNSFTDEVVEKNR
jgi:CheY-like chemotaxis protein